MFLLTFPHPDLDMPKCCHCFL